MSQLSRIMLPSSASTAGAHRGAGHSRPGRRCAAAARRRVIPRCFRRRNYQKGAGSRKLPRWSGTATGWRACASPATGRSRRSRQGSWSAPTAAIRRSPGLPGRGKYNLTLNERFAYWSFFAGADLGADPAAVFHRWSGNFVIGIPADSLLYQVIALPGLSELPALPAEPRGKLPGAHPPLRAGGRRASGRTAGRQALRHAPLGGVLPQGHRAGLGAGRRLGVLPEIAQHLHRHGSSTRSSTCSTTVPSPRRC